MNVLFTHTPFEHLARGVKHAEYSIYILVVSCLILVHGIRVELSIIRQIFVNLVQV